MDIVERLRETQESITSGARLRRDSAILKDAADEIERLRASAVGAVTEEAYRRFPDGVEHDGWVSRITHDRGAERYAFMEGARFAVGAGVGAENERLRHWVSNLLARIHRDGGHYEAEHGTEKACADADEKLAWMLVAYDAVGADVGAGIDLVNRSEVIRICEELGQQSADLALYGAPDNARSREAMEAAATRLACAVAIMPSAVGADVRAETMAALEANIIQTLKP